MQEDAPHFRDSPGNEVVGAEVPLIWDLFLDDSADLGIH